MDLNLKNKYALITGGSHGIGRSIALMLAQEGCNVAVCARQKLRLAKFVKETQQVGVQAIGIPADVMKKKDIDKVMSVIIEKWGTIHILVNNVGGGGRWGSNVVEETIEDVWLDVYNKNALAAIRFTMRAIPLMKKQKWGRVVSIASIYGREGGGRPWFNMAKGAEISLMKTLAMNSDLARSGITFNTICPGSIMIPDTGWEKERQENPEAFKKITEQLPLGRMGTPEEVAYLATCLCGESASLINGACITADGGESRSF